MKRITVSLPDELAEKVRRAAGGERRVSSYVAAALEDYAERENLDEVLAEWNAETPVPDEVRQQVQAELDRAGLTGASGRNDRADRESQASLNDRVPPQAAAGPFPAWRNEVTLRSVGMFTEYEPGIYLPFISPTPC
ncbi:MAG: hypothetical protein ACRDP7_06545 [Trebonia sp.]